ncbi:NFACT RNA binding domain-containing protein [Hydrogenimonas urashimensis]|uniref:NFACT RNA binding domain-containing protein n=1 Tax=Hydrogenimonas urashimensis TaxID=2740515 RepID=UPI001915A750|nr:NFACT RNA binding domain-containing protein [Hydrogenimonas urashimensis]
MKYYQLKAVADYLKRFGRIRKAERIDDNVIRLFFDRAHAIAFDLTRGGGDIFEASDLHGARSYHAPFDTMLKKRFGGAKILDVSMVGGDRILRIDAVLEGAYKALKSTLQLEFTGRHTNAIILDDKGNVLEALRHVDSDASFRVVKPGVPLKPLPPYAGPRKEGHIDDVKTWLTARAAERAQTRLERLKARHSLSLEKKIERLKKELAKLPDKAALEKRADEMKQKGAIVLAHLHEINPYDTKLETLDFQGNPVRIDLPGLPNPKRMGEHFYALSKRAANKAARLHIEEESLKSRLAFYERLRENVQKAKREEEISLLFPPRVQRKKKEAGAQCEIFWIDNFRVMVGRNERENIWVLKHARASDLWLHLKDRPSAHCIIQSGGKKQIPREIVEKAARICVETSVMQPGNYPVDVTQRRNVKIVHGAHVNYVNYDTIMVKKM